MTTIDFEDFKKKLKKDYKELLKENINEDIFEGIDFLDYLLFAEGYSLIKFEMDSECFNLIQLHVTKKSNVNIRIYNFTFENSRFYTFKDIVEMRDYIIAKIEQYER